MATPRQLWFSVSIDGQLDTDRSPVALAWRARGIPGHVDLGGRVRIRSDSEVVRTELGALLGTPIARGDVQLPRVQIPATVEEADSEAVSALGSACDRLGIAWLEPVEKERVDALEQWVRAWQMGIEDARPTVARLRWCAAQARRSEATPDQSRERSVACQADDVSVQLTSAIARHERDWTEYAAVLAKGEVSIHPLLARWRELESRADARVGAASLQKDVLEEDVPPETFEELLERIVDLEATVGTEYTPARQTLERARVKLGDEPPSRTLARLERAQMLALPAFDVHVEDLHTPLDRGISQLRQLEARIRVGLADLQRLNPELAIPCQHVLALEVAMMTSGASNRLSEIERFVTSLDVLRVGMSGLALTSQSTEIFGDVLADVWDLGRVLDALARADV